jgi:hypothetical protein
LDESPQIEPIETIILRFRDLVTDPGKTVEEHNTISNSQGHVWWGWWNKFGEQVPVSTFTALLERIRKSGSLRILLMEFRPEQGFREQL